MCAPVLPPGSRVTSLILLAFTFSSHSPVATAQSPTSSPSTTASSGEAAWEAFDKNLCDSASGYCFWTSNQGYSRITGGYTGSVSTTVSGTVYSGEWLQIQFPASVSLTSYLLYTRPNLLARGPMEFVVASSSDGSTWTLVDYRNSTSNWTTSGRQYALGSTAAPATYFRVIVVSTMLANENDDSTSIAEWVLYESPLPVRPPPPPHPYRRRHPSSAISLPVGNCPLAP